MHRTLKQEPASPPAAEPTRQQECFARFQQMHNEERPREALGQNTPVSCYETSRRVYPERLGEGEHTISSSPDLPAFDNAPMYTIFRYGHFARSTARLPQPPTTNTPQIPHKSALQQFQELRTNAAREFDPVRRGTAPSCS